MSPRALFLVLSLVTATAHAAHPEIVMGVLASRGVEEAEADWQPIVDDLSAATGQNVKLVALKTEQELLSEFGQNHIQIARLGTQAALTSVEQKQGQIFARLALTGGVSEFRSVLLTRKDGPASLDEVLRQPKHWRYATGTQDSTANYLIPQYYAFAKNNVLVTQFFNQISNGASEDNFRALVDRRADVASTNSDDLEKLHDKYPRDYQQLRVIWESPAFSYDPLIMRKDLPPAMQQKISQFFLNYGRKGANATHEKEKLYYADELSGFLPSSNRQLREVTDLQLFYALFQLALDKNSSAAASAQTEKTLYRRYNDLVGVLGGAR
ncbi:phosphate/phosphite/phosphonate ABC transporter substrate-binding protein [Silvimonas amylolytica]|uniref:Phosphonates ABC transporter substrate-binding protein PhnL n=1 Tax=Silvimonas amylolytica TaxID=449663 RepID=A0ABQ2PMZ7_9NEIS|nr:phosphate/phosphite/phosphonate ABC transporter substrate-binding protein [Silvimonas amylolytica]GGP26686.1 phosphonates ABC transporter substrate-binding protein PhnL [Silvimonas amylolytica]